MKYGKTIKKMREDAGLTQSQLAEKSAITTSYMSLIESDERKPSLIQLEKISHALGTNMVALVKRAEGL